MRWEDGRSSDNVEDRRDVGGGGGGFRLGGGGLSIGTVVVALLASWVLGVNPLTVLGVLQGGGQAGPAAPVAGHAPPANDSDAAFVSKVLASTEDVWGAKFSAAGGRYDAPRLVLFRGSTPTACGTGEAAMGPFYCPGDRQVYIDLAFYDTLKRQLGAPGDLDRKSTRLNSSHSQQSRMPSSA